MSDITKYATDAPAGAALIAQAMGQHEGAGRYRAMQSIMDWDRSRLAYRAVKRTFDIVFSGVVLVIIAIPSLVLAALIRLESEGSPFYSQIRVGQTRPDGSLTTFRMWKFRSMYRDADERLAELKSLTMKAQEELDAFCAQGDPQLTMDNLARVIELWTKIPASRIREDEFRRLSELDKRLKEHIVGQDEAIEAVAAAIRRNRVGISPKHKPVSFIFVGPTGVGKTELVKQLAQDLFNSPDALIRFDMSEFMEKHSVSRIVGSPPGYVGYDEAGQLTEKIRRKPYAVILFDEIEKAHPDVMNVLLQILDDGEITDSHGRKVNFENTVIVMTSNAGSERKEGTVGFGHTVNEQNRDRAMKALGEFLRPEFLNRVDEVICFNRLDEKNFAGIAHIMLDELQKSLEDKGLHFTWDEDVEDYLVKKSYSATYGARNLRRTIQKELEDVMAAQIIDSYEHPVTQIHASVEDGKLVVRSL